MPKVRKRIPANELPGETMGREHAAEFADPRDVMSRDRRVAECDELHGLHERNNDLSHVPYGQDAILYGGPKGSAKTAAAMVALASYFAMGGYVFHLGGVAFGQKLSLTDMMRFPDICPPQSVVLWDEVHLGASNYGAGSLVNELANNSLSLTRHAGNDVHMTSTIEGRIDWGVRSQIRTAVYPMQYYPKAGRFYFPPKCYIWPWIIGDYPWEDRTPRLIDVLGPGIAKTPVLVQRTETPIMPSNMYKVWCLYDTWSEPKVSERAGLTADVVRQELVGSGTAGQVDEFERLESTDAFFSSLLSIVEGGDFSYGRSSTAWRYIDEAAREGGWHADDQYAGLHILQRHFPNMDSQNRVRSAELRDFLKRIGEPGSIDAAAD